MRVWSDYVGTISRRVIEAAKKAKLQAASNGRYMTQFENNLRGIGVNNIEGQTRDDFISWFVEAHDYVVSSANNGIDTMLASCSNVRGPPPPPAPSTAARPSVKISDNRVGTASISPTHVIIVVGAAGGVEANKTLAVISGYGMVGQEFYGTETIALNNVALSVNTVDSNYIRTEQGGAIEVTTVAPFPRGSIIEVGFNNLWLGPRGGVTAWLGAQRILSERSNSNIKASYHAFLTELTKGTENASPEEVLWLLDGLGYIYQALSLLSGRSNDGAVSYA